MTVEPSASDPAPPEPISPSGASVLPRWTALLVGAAGAAGAAASLAVVPSPWPAVAWLCLPVAAVGARWGHRAALAAAVAAALPTAVVLPTPVAGLVALAVLVALGQSVAVMVRQVHDGHLRVAVVLEEERRDAVRAAAERDALSLRLSHLAQHDTLTGLPNRSRFLEALQEVLRRREGTVGVLFIDLDDFKTVNDSLGHAAGDELLIGVARRLQNALRDGDLVARFGGDEFAVLLLGGTEDQLAGMARRLLGVLRAPFALSAGMASGQGSGGLAVAEPGSGAAGSPAEQADDVLRQADLAMYAAKGRGAGFSQFHPSMQAAILERLSLQDDITRALIQEEFVLAYQPVVDLRTGRVVTVEALLRWEHPERGDIAPEVFVPIAERSGAIVQLGLWVLEQACLDLRLWDDLCPGNDLRLAVNVSARQLRDSSVGPQIARVLHRTRVDPRRLVLEVTESLLMDDDDAASATLWQLRALGIRIAVDHFGTGYSSLSRLVDLPLDDLKIDRSFVAELDRSDAGATIITAAVAMAHGLGLNVVAEGVESVEQRDFLTSAGCDQAQGPLFSLRVPSDAVVGLLRRGAAVTELRPQLPGPRRGVPAQLPARPTPTVIPSLPRHR